MTRKNKYNAWGLNVRDLMPEASFQAEVQRYASTQGWLSTHITDSRYTTGQAGAPDVLMVRNGEIILAELKSKAGRLTSQQQLWIREYPKTYVWRPSDKEEIMEVLKNDNDPDAIE